MERKEEREDREDKEGKGRRLEFSFYLRARK